MTIRATITGVGHHLPERVVPNAEFAERLDTSDEWIRERTGIERRHFAGEGETTPPMGAEAPRRARALAGAPRAAAGPRRPARGGGEPPSAMGAGAARRALAMAGRQASEVDAVIVATSTPD